MRLVTESGTSYYIAFRPEGKVFVRSPASERDAMPWDGREVRFIFFTHPKVNHPMELVCEPLVPGGDICLVRTSKVTRTEL